MGIHWYALSREMIEVERALEAVEHRIFAPDATEATRDAALAEREMLYEREDATRRAMEQRGRGVGVEVIRDWPEEVQRHAAAYGTPREGQSFLDDFIGPDTDYYVEILADAGVPMDGFSYPLRSLDLQPEQARQLALELLRYVDRLEAPSPVSWWWSKRRAQKAQATRARQARATRVAALWLWFWAWLDCRIEAGN
jgi:hypothetical protein